MAEDKFDRTEQATPRKLQEAREKGQVAKSKEVSSLAILLASIGVFYFFGEYIILNINGIIRGFIMESATFVLTTESAVVVLKQSLKGMFFIMLPFFFFPLIGVAANVVQIGFIFSLDPITPKLSKINPIEGLGRIFSPTSAVEMVKTLIKFVVIGYIGYTAMKGELSGFSRLADTEVITVITYLAKTSLKILVKTSWVLIVIAILDYIFQKWERDRNLKMSKHEVKEEYKDTEGQPLVKARIRTLQRQMARQRMMQEVPEATVVVTNPTHYAIALKYEQGMGSAPTVVAKGKGHIAQKIKAIAKENGVPTVENKPLARTLWKIADIGGEIPNSLYQAVAEILAYVYRLKARR